MLQPWRRPGRRVGHVRTLPTARSAAGAGLTGQEVNKLLKQHQQMQTMMKRVKKMGHKGFLQRGLPPGLMPR